MVDSKGFKYNWFSNGDIGASATIIFDNLTVLTFMSLILTFGYHFPTDIILSHIIPGTVIAVMVGNLLFFYLSFRLAKKEQRQVTAVPFGLDAPTAIGFSVLIIGPSFNQMQQTGLDITQAALASWHIGMGCVFIVAIIKIVCSLFVRQLKAAIPPAALLGAIAGVAIAFIGFFPLISIFKTPIVGITVLGIILLTMFAKIRLPFNMSSIPVAIIIGSLLYYALIPFNLSGPMPDLSTHLAFMLPKPTFSFFNEAHYIIDYIPVVIPFALLVVFGNMAVAESSACLGEVYIIRDIIIIDAIATFIGAICGGVSQTTAYAGFPAYKKLDARAGYLLINFLVVGVGGLCGLVGFLVHLVPEATLAPILLFVAFEIAMQGFVQSEKKYTVALLFAMYPSIARLVEIKLTDGSLISSDKLQTLAFANSVTGVSDFLALVIMGNGFIITGTLWGALLCYAIDKKWFRSSVCALILAVFSYFGVIHSIYISGRMYLPRMLPESVQHIPLELALGYISFAILILLLSKLHNKFQIL